MSADRPRMKSPAAAGGLVRDLLRGRGMEEKMRDYRAWQVWDEVVGPQIAARARPSRIRDGVLEVRVDQPVWMQQLQLMKPAILTRLRNHLGGSAITDIYLLRGKAETPVWTAPKPAPHSLPPLDEGERASVEAMVDTIADKELQDTLRAFFTRQKQVDKLRRG